MGRNGRPMTFCTAVESSHSHRQAGPLATWACHASTGPRPGLTGSSPRSTSAGDGNGGRRQNAQLRRRLSARRSWATTFFEPARQELPNGHSHASRGAREPRRRRGAATAELGQHGYGGLGSEEAGGDVWEVEKVTPRLTEAKATQEVDCSGGNRRRSSPGSEKRNGTASSIRVVPFRFLARS